MPASGQRFYMLELRHRAAVWGDLGNLIKIEGIVVGGEGALAALMLPDWKMPAVGFLPKVVTLTMEEWTDWLQRSDAPEILVQGSMEKVFHRKLRYEISGHTQQKVWAADGFKCMYCKQPMPKVQLTIDHWESVEAGGKNDTSNYLSCCRRENKEKGAMAPRDWCELKGLDYGFFVRYLRDRKVI